MIRVEVFKQKNLRSKLFNIFLRIFILKGKKEDAAKSFMLGIFLIIIIIMVVLIYEGIKKLIRYYKTRKIQLKTLYEIF